MDLKAVMEEDDKWFKKQQEAKNKKKEEPVKVVKLANGKVKKGSGMRYDKKLGFERYVFKDFSEFGVGCWPERK